MRENGESIALLGGEEEERSGIDKSLTNVVLKQWARLWRAAHADHGRVAGIEPDRAGDPDPALRAEIPRGSACRSGEVMQAASAFTIVQQALFGWLVDNYPRACRMECGCAPDRIDDDVARWA